MYGQIDIEVSADTVEAIREGDMKAIAVSNVDLDIQKGCQVWFNNTTDAIQIAVAITHVSTRLQSKDQVVISFDVVDKDPLEDKSQLLDTILEGGQYPIYDTGDKQYMAVGGQKYIVELDLLKLKIDLAPTCITVSMVEGDLVAKSVLGKTTPILINPEPV